MTKARKEVELAVRVSNQPTAMRTVLETIANADINVLAYCTYSDRTESVVLLVTEDPSRAKTVLQAAGLECRANSVVLVGAKERVGAAAQLGSHLARAGVDILYSYASSGGGQEFFAVFKTSDDERALRALRQNASVAQAA